MEGKVREKMWESKIRNWCELAKRVFGCSIKDTGIAKFSVKIVKRERERERERKTFKEQMSERQREWKWRLGFGFV
jgi:choline kinase